MHPAGSLAVVAEQPIRATVLTLSSDYSFVHSPKLPLCRRAVLHDDSMARSAMPVVCSSTTVVGIAIRMLGGSHAWPAAGGGRFCARHGLDMPGGAGVGR